MKKALLLAIACLILQACASGAEPKNMTLTFNEIDGYQINPQLSKSVTVRQVKGGSETNPLWASEISDASFQRALVDTLSNFGYLNSTKKSRYNLSVSLVDVKKPSFGLDLEVTTRIRYILTDSKLGNDVFKKVIEVSYTATFSDAAMAIKRLRLANEGSAKKSIQEFIRVLESLDIQSVSVSMH